MILAHRIITLHRPVTILSQKDRRIFVRLARNWAARGYYHSPSEAMQVLLEGDEPWN